eukprot:COSAG02_NODE_6565_length_3492_cov_1.855585_3_plen_43_part_00
MSYIHLAEGRCRGNKFFRFYDARNLPEGSNNTSDTTDYHSIR